MDDTTNTTNSSKDSHAPTNNHNNNNNNNNNNNKNRRNRNRNRGGRGRGRSMNPNGGRGKSRTTNTNNINTTNASNQNNNNSQCVPIDEPTEPPTPSVTEHDHHFCLVCYDPILHLARGIAPCGHDDICAACHLRLRSLLGDTNCPICKAPNDVLIVDADPNPDVDTHTVFDEYERWGDELGPGYKYREEVGMFFPTNYYHSNVLPLFSLACTIRGCSFDNGQGSGGNGTLSALKNHLKTHSPPLQLCDLCIDNKRNFISQLPRYTAQQLTHHNKYGDIPSGSKRKGKGNKSAVGKGHPLCEFCRPRRFYDLTALHEHLNKDHYKCHICEKMDKPNQFFKDYASLQKHFDRMHFLCHHPTCLAARFVVFSNEVDLGAHERSVHGVVQGGSTKIQMEFRVRRGGRDGSGFGGEVQRVPDLEEDFAFGLDGEAFVPEGLEGGEENIEEANEVSFVQQEQEPDITHGPHAQRTAWLREQARMRRLEMGMEESQQAAKEAFPALGAQNASSENLVGWSSSQSTRTAIRGRNTTSLTEDNFPSLGDGGSKKTGAFGSKLKATKNRSNTSSMASFSAISLAANAGSSSSITRPATTTASTVMASGNFLTPVASSSRVNRAQNLSADNFPVLGGGSASTSMGTTSAPRYAAANSLVSSRRNQPTTNLGDLNRHFPSMSSNLDDRKPAARRDNKQTVFSAKPPSREMLNNVLAFPPPANSNGNDGKSTIEAMKLTLGTQKYKTLKGFTKKFASNSLDPETYVTSCASLFENGMQNRSFWEFIPDLIATCPNESNAKRASRYLENLKLSGLNYEKEGHTNSFAGSEDHTKSTTNSMHAISVPRYSAATAFAANHSNSGISNSSLLTTGSSRNNLPIPHPPTKAAWGGNSKGKVSKVMNGSAVAVAASEQPQNGSATKFMANEKKKEKKMKQQASEKAQVAGNVKKKKAKAKKDELRNLAFGNI